MREVVAQKQAIMHHDRENIIRWLEDLALRALDEREIHLRQLEKCSRIVRYLDQLNELR